MPPQIRSVNGDKGVTRGCNLFPPRAPHDLSPRVTVHIHVYIYILETTCALPLAPRFALLPGECAMSGGNARGLLGGPWDLHQPGSSGGRTRHPQGTSGASRGPREPLGRPADRLGYPKRTPQASPWLSRGPAELQRILLILFWDAPPSLEAVPGTSRKSINL